MIEYFPKINYDFEGITLSVTNIFKSVKLEIDTPNTVLTYALSGQRPDVLANTLYNNSNLFWSFFLTNNIKNPLTEWGQIQSSYTDRINAEYDGWEYQFANTSQFIPGNTFNFNSTTTNPYDGIDFKIVNITNKYIEYVVDGVVGIIDANYDFNTFGDTL